MNHENIKYETEKIDYKHEIAQGCHWEIQVCHFSQNTEFPIKTTELFKQRVPPLVAHVLTSCRNMD